MDRISESEVVLIPSDPRVDETARMQDHCRAVAALYRRRQQQREIFHGIIGPIVFGAMVALITVFLLELLGAL